MSKHIALTGGGTAGHIEPMLATAAALKAADPSIEITCIGSRGGLETTLVPERGFELKVVPAVPLPRKPSTELITLVPRLASAVKQTRAILKTIHADAVVGFGGYAALPAYLAARSMKIPIVVHEANLTPGLANKIGARFAKAVATAAPIASMPAARVVGMPLRESLTTLDRAAHRDEALRHFGLLDYRPTLLVYGGSQGARTLNTAVVEAAESLHKCGIQILHAYGKKNTVAVPTFTDGPKYVAVPYIDRMDLAYAAADFVLCRCGMGTVAEVSAVGLPACYVPLPHGNGEQRLNAEPVVAVGGGLIVDDAALSADYLRTSLAPLITNSATVAEMAQHATGAGHREAAGQLAQLVLQVAR